MDKQKISTGGCFDCGGRCPYSLHVTDGKITRIEPYQDLKACVRGYAMRKRVYSSDRLQYPLLRTGERGEGKFKRISWDEAFDRVANELIRVKNSYGNSAILLHQSSPLVQHSVQSGAVPRLLNMFGGCVGVWGGASAEASEFASRATYGTLTTGHTRDDLVNSKLLLLWGWNPMVTVWGTGTSYELIKAKEAGAKIICVDPRFHKTAAILADQWIPIRPGTDAAMLIAMAHNMIAEDTLDKEFLEKYTVGFEVFQDYVLGKEDGIPKTPEWAEEISGVPAETIKSLAREYATSKPAALIAGYAPGRTAYGEQFHRMLITLAAMTGNVGKSGGNSAGFERSEVGIMFGSRLPTGKNPVEAGFSLKGTLSADKRSSRRIHILKIWDSLLKGKEGGYPYDNKLLYLVGANPIVQNFNINKGIEALKKPEFIVVQEQFLTPTAKFADVVLPVNTHWERDDFSRPWLSGAYYICVNKAIENLHESKSDYEICCELALRLGIQNYTENKTVDDWRREIIAKDSDTRNEITDYEKFKKEGIWNIHLDGPIVGFKKEIEDPDNNPFPTPSGKIEIYSQKMAELNDPLLPPIPKYLDAWEGPNSPLRHKYPLQLITQHLLTRAHSCFAENEWLKDLVPQAIWISQADARERNINDNDVVRVLNDRGQLTIKAKVTERIMPGVVGIPQGAWYNPDQEGVDHGGSPNILFDDVHSPGGAWPTNTALVQVEKM